MATLFAANILFSGVLILLWVSFIRSSRVTECFGVELSCQWIDGVITPIGRRTIALKTAIYIVLNLTPLLIVIFSSGRSDRATELAKDGLAR